MVSHFDSAEGKIRTRRLFTNINRNAKATSNAENIVLDEDDGAAILTRRLLTEHPFLSRKGVVKVFTSVGDEGVLKLAAGNVPQGDKLAFTTIANLYDIVRTLSFDLDPSMKKPQARPSDEVLEASYSVIASRLDDIIKAAGDVRTPLDAETSAKDLRAPKGKEATGSPFMRPVVQKAVARVVSEIASQGALAWPEIMKRLAGLKWRIGEGPWLSVFNATNGKMISAKENAELLRDLLYVHLAAPSKQAIVRARKQYKELKGSAYSVSEEELLKSLTPHTEGKIEVASLVPEAAPAGASDESEGEA
ncbi:hypothetical protein E1H18_786 [Caulobacter sp. RHG1]|nr:hypothetical protein [Caulobacter sp. RHG1]